MISVIMGLHRLDHLVYPAIDSILNQSNVELEFIIVANGKDFSQIKDALQKHYANESRIRIYTTPVGQLSHALNIALAHAKYDYVARMDGDDVSHPNRLCKQMEYLLLNKLDMVGSAVCLINEDGVNIGSRSYPAANKINKLMYFKNCFAHNTVLYKKEVIINARGYNSGFNSEDYDLWLRLRRRRVKWDNMQEELLDYRIHEAASQRNILGYAETAGYMIREFVLSKNPIWMLSSFITIAKAFIRGR